MYTQAADLTKRRVQIPAFVKTLSESRLLRLVRIFLSYVDVAALNHACLFGQRYQYRIQNLLILQLETGGAVHLCVWITILQRQITDFVLNEPSRKGIDSRHIASDRGGCGLHFFSIGERRHYRVIRYVELFVGATVFEVQA